MIIQRIKQGLSVPEIYMMVFVICVWAFQPLIFNISVFASKFVGIFFDILFYLFVFFVFIKAKPVWIKKIRGFDVVFYFSCIFITLLSIAFFPEAADQIEDVILPFFLQVLTCYFVGLFIDVNKQKDYIYYASVITVIFQFIYFFFFIQRLGSVDDLKGDLIVPATYTLPHIMVVIWYTLKKFNIVNALLSLMSILLLLTFSNRGSMLAVVLFLVVYLLFLVPSKTKTSTKVLLFSSLFVLVGFVVAFFNQVLEFVFNLFQNLGLSTSFVLRVMEEEATDSNGRLELYEKALHYILGDGSLGSGMGADRVLLGTYVHDLVLELLIDFGVIFGSLLAVSFFILVLRAFKKAVTIDEKAFIAVLCGRGMIHLLFSGSYIEDGHFFLLIGFCIATLRQSKRKTQLVHQ